jgi:hypothetical protein
MRRVLGTDHPDTLRSAHSLAAAGGGSGDHGQARSASRLWTQWSTTTCRRRLGWCWSQHPIIVANLIVGLYAVVDPRVR